MRIHLNIKGNYFCNTLGISYAERMSKKWEDVTCKLCLRWSKEAEK